jgi:cytochrome c oxidase cbb3-type subunit 3
MQLLFNGNIKKRFFAKPAVGKAGSIAERIALLVSNINKQTLLSLSLIPLLTACMGSAAAIAQNTNYPRAVSWMGKDPLAQENAKRGAAVFQQSCAFCHGKNADGGSEAPNLIRSLLVRHDKDGDLIGPVIQEGRPDRGMPAIRLPAAQSADVVVYLHALLSVSDSAGDSGPSSNYSLKLLLTGNAERGKEFFNGRGGCFGCHSPYKDLAHISTKYPPINLQDRFLYPVGMPSVATITLPSGATIAGPLVHLDAFSVAITDPDGWYRSWPVADVKVSVKDPLAQHHALITQYTNEDLHNVFAYLESLK